MKKKIKSGDDGLSKWWEYVKKGERQVHTNAIEGYWSYLKRGITGIYHHISTDYLQSYVSEFCFRYNNRENENSFDLVLAKECEKG